jgi:hypothetical protein
MGELKVRHRGHTKIVVDGNEITMQYKSFEVRCPSCHQLFLIESKKVNKIIPVLENVSEKLKGGEN